MIDAMRDYTPITELPTSLLNREQLGRIAQRYQLALDHAANRRVLEVACGAGMGLGLLTDVARSVVGLDYTEHVLQVAHAQYTSQPTLALLGGDAQQLPCLSEQFDLLLNFEAIYYLPDPHAFLAEAWRVLDDDGTLIICTSNPDWPNFVAGALTVHYPNLRELHQWVQAAGFVDIVCFGAFPTSATGPLKRLTTPLRRLVLQSGVIAPESALGTYLKRIAYGPLSSLPAEITPSQLTAWAQSTSLVPIDCTEPDYQHRVLYCMAKKRM